MRSQRITALAAVGLFISTQVPSCRTVPPSDPSAQQMQDNMFLDGVNKELRDKYPDSVLIAEGHKVCDALSQGQSEHQVAEMVKKDFAGTAPTMFTLVATIGFCPAKAPG
jgi:hypothetical protein